MFNNPTFSDLKFVAIGCFFLWILSFFIGDDVGEGKEQLPRLRSEFNLILGDVVSINKIEESKANHYAYIHREIPETFNEASTLPLMLQQLKTNHWQLATKANDSFIYCKDDLRFELLPPSHESQIASGGVGLIQQKNMIIAEIRWGRSSTEEFCK